MTGVELLEDPRMARASDTALAAINIYDTVQALALAVADAAQSEQARVILQTGSSSFALVGEAPLIAAAATVRGSAGGLLNVHLDHCRDLNQVRRCLDAGYDSIMFDASHLTGGQQRPDPHRGRPSSSLRRQGRKRAGRATGPGGPDGRSGNRLDASPRRRRHIRQGDERGPARCRRRQRRWGPRHPVHLALYRLADIRRAVDVPLALHGASGLPDQEVLGAIKLGVCKVKINTEVRRAYLAALRDSLTTSNSDDLTAHLNAARAAAAT